MSVKGQQAAHELCLMPGSFQCIWKILVIGRRKEGRKGRSKELKSQKERKQKVLESMWEKETSTPASGNVAWIWPFKEKGMNTSPKVRN